jgi:excisionase family DNA binding protein
MTPSTPDTLATSIADFARSIGISRRSVYSLLDRGEGPPTIRIGRRRVIRREAADAWLRSREA